MALQLARCRAGAAPFVCPDGVSDLRSRAVPCLPYRRRRRVGHAAAFPRGERAQKKSTRSVSRWRCSSIATILALAAAEQADQPRAPRRRGADPARFSRRAGGARVGAASVTVPEVPSPPPARGSRRQAAPSAPIRLLRRLTHSQYNNTVRDLLGDYSRPADRFPPEDFVSGFKNQLRTQGMPPVLEDAYSAAAEKLALNAFRAGDVNGLRPMQAGVRARREVPRSVRAGLRRAGVPASADRRRDSPLHDAVHRAGGRRPASSSRGRASSSRRCCSRRSSSFTRESRPGRPVP